MLEKAVVNIGLSEVVRQNSIDMQMLAGELITESGPPSSRKSRERMYSQQKKHPFVISYAAGPRQ